MELKTRLLLIFFLLTSMREARAGSGPHPHGRDEILVRIERRGDIAEFNGNKELIEQTFGHPQIKDRKVVVFSIIGAYRHGKSFFLDYCLRYLYANYGSVNTTEMKTVSNDWIGDPNEELLGFSWKHGSTADTKGLKMWSDVFLYDAPDGEKIAIVIIDTQGLFEKFSTDEENAKIFSFSSLVSSIQIINIKERIAENHITHLQTAIELTKLITMKEKGYKKKKAFQHLIFLIRDFADEAYKHGYEGGKEYIDDFFNNLSDDVEVSETSMNDGDQQSSRANVNRRSIQESFENITCFLLNFPGENIRRANFKGEWGKLNKEFVDNLKFFIESLLAPERLIKKSLLGSEMTGQKFKDILIALGKAYSAYKVPQVDTILQITIDNEMSAIVEKEFKNYKDKITGGKINYDRKDFQEWLENKHEKYFTYAVDEFLRAEKIEDEPSQEKFKKILEDDIQEFYNSFKKQTLEAYIIFTNEKEMQAVVESKSEEYRREINDDVNLKVDNFEQSIKERHLHLKIRISDEFVKATKKLNDTIRSESFRKKLEEEIDKSFEIWKQPTIKRWQEHQVKSYANSELQIYRQSINNESDFNRENFETHINQKHLEFREKALRSFLNETANKFGNDTIQKTLRTLENDIESTFQTLKISKLKDYKNFQDLQDQKTRAELSAIVQSLSYRYETLMNANLNFSAEDFPSILDGKHEPVKATILKEFLDQAKDYKTMLIEKHKQELKRTLDTKFRSWKSDKLESYKAYLQRQKEILRKDMTILIQKYDFKYKDMMLENLSFNAQNFEKLIDDKHKSVMQSILKDFTAEAQTSDYSFVRELANRLENTFAGLREKKIREHLTVVEQERILSNLKIDAIITKKLYEYKESIERNIDYEQEDFTSWLQNKHENIKQRILEDFSSLPEVKESFNSHDAEEKLQNEIESAFQALKSSKIEIHRLNMERINKQVDDFLDTLVNSQLHSYENDLVTGLNFGTEDFDQVLLEKFYTSKNTALDGFAAATNKPQYFLKKAEGHKKLSEEIQKSFDSFKPKASAENIKALQLIKKKKENEIVELADEKFTEFKKKLGLKTYTDSDFEKDNFELGLKNDFETLKHKILSDFKSAASDYTDSTFNVRLSNELSNRIDAHFESWKGEILSLKEGFDQKEKDENEKKLRKVKDEKLSQYLKEMEGKVKYIISKQELHAAHTFAKTTAVNAYNVATADYKDLISVQLMRSNLERDISEAYSKIQIVDINDAKKLRTTGIWIPWEGSRNDFPPRAVIAGFLDDKGCAVVRFQGKAGEWCVKRSNALVNTGTNNEKALTSPTFEILLHSKWKYVNYRRADSYTTITILVINNN